ncbi:Lrp/AsnC family transcriptional regulator [Hyphococcus sp. DH-69]|uniref:Lrp/AsnC family transcriptional regulator n=1 Tax=Hyphococcus formosus TaxID=3143534 RepID=UPI00398BB48A
MQKNQGNVRIKIDKLNIRILETLQTEARISYPKMSSKVGLSPSPCFNRVKKLEEGGVINGYHADVNLRALAPHVSVLTMIQFDNHGQENERLFREFVQKTDTIVSAQQASGQIDYILYFVCPTMQAYRDTADRLLEENPAVVKLETIILLDQVKKFTGYPLQELLNST